MFALRNVLTLTPVTVGGELHLGGFYKISPNRITATVFCDIENLYSPEYTVA